MHLVAELRMYTTTTMYYWNHINTFIGDKMRVLLISLATAISLLASAQSKDQNYVMSRHYLDDKGAAIATVYTPQRGYTLSYDNLNRLTKAEYSEGDGTSDATGHYDECAAYDVNGNSYG